MPVIIFVAESSNGGVLGFLESVYAHMLTDVIQRILSVLLKAGMCWMDIEPGIGKKLVRAAEEWARTQGCTEMASDTLIENELSQKAHQALSYTVVDRCVHYRRRL